VETVYDWVSVAIFAGIVVLFIQRSTADEPAHAHDSLFLYFGAALGCAVADYLGNHGFDILAVLVIAATLFFIVYYLRPLKSWPKG
jgi:hypothetical protein